MFIKPLKFIGLIMLGVMGLLLWARPSAAIDTRRITGYTEIYGDINVEVRATGRWFKDATEMDQAFIHYYNLGVSSYIWDPRLVQFNVAGNFSQQISRGDTGDGDLIIYGGSGMFTFFPESQLPLTIRGSREQIIDPQLTITQGEGSVAFLRRGWPGVYLTGSWTNYKSDEKDFRQDVDYLSGSARLVYQIIFRPVRPRLKGNGQNGNNGNNGNNAKKNGTNGEMPLPSRLLLDIDYDYRRTEDRIADLSADEHRGVIFLGYFFNNNRTNITNNTVWHRISNSDNYQDYLNYFHQWSPTFNYNLGGFYSYTTKFFIDKVTNTDVQSAGAFANLTKIFSPQWWVRLGAEGHFASDVNKDTSWGASGYGGLYSRVFSNLDWGATVSGGANTDRDNNTTSNYALFLGGLYRLTPSMTLSTDDSFTYYTGLNNTHGWDGRARLTYDAFWAPDLTLRTIAEYRYQDSSELLNDVNALSSTGGKVQSGTFDIYGLYRLAPKTSLYAGVNFTYLNADSRIDKFARVYATITSNPWENFNYSLTAGYDYAIDGKSWNVRISPQIFYVWHQIYFSLIGEFDYLGRTNNADSNQWNYYVSFKVSRPFSIKFF